MLKKIVTVLSLLLMPVSLCGCTESQMGGMSQSQRQAYIKEYLKNTYNLDCELTEIKKKQINVFENEDEYSTIATTDDGFWFAIWITDGGEIKDTAFAYELKDGVNDYLEEKFAENGIECDVYDRWVFNDYSSKEWTVSEIELMYQSENISDVIHIFMEQPVSEENVKTALADYKNFSLCSYVGAVCVHYDTMDESNIDFDNYDVFIDLDQ